jgi:hypothetical protein
MRKRDALNSATCPICKHHPENDNHVCTCPDKRVRNICQSGLKALNGHLTKVHTDPVLQTLFCAALSDWLWSEQTTFDVAPPADHPFAALLSQAITDQNRIGWDQIVRGRLATAWGDCYISWCAYAYPEKPTATAASWLNKVAAWGLNLFLQLWDHRNSVAHAATSDAQTSISHSHLQAKVKDYYSRSSTLPRADQDAFFRDDIDTFQHCQPYVLAAWIEQVERIFIRHRKEIRQRHARSRITFYFKPPTPVEPLPAPTAI